MGSARRYGSWGDHLERDARDWVQLEGRMDHWLETMNRSASRGLTGLLRQNPSPRVCWYPSAGTDFRDLLYLHPTYRAEYPPFGDVEEPAAPDLFLHTDYFSQTGSTFLDRREVFNDGRTLIRVEEIEEMPSLDLPLDPRLVDFPRPGRHTNRVVFLRLRVESHVLGAFSQPVIYVFSENAAFCARELLRTGARLSHIICIRHGGCLGGGKLGGSWLTSMLRPLGAEALIADRDPRTRASGDTLAFDAFPELTAARDSGPIPELTLFREMPGAYWSDCGMVNWFRVQ